MELSSASPNVINGSFEVTLTPGALIIIVWVRRLFPYLIPPPNHLDLCGRINQPTLSGWSPSPLNID